MFTWGAAGGRALESARVLFAGGRGLRALGRAVRAEESEPAFTASYRLVVDEDGAVARLAVTSATADRERTVALYRTEDGYWMQDTGTAGGRQDFGGALDVDLAYSPLFTSLPVRRLGLHRDAGHHEVPVVFGALPELTVTLVVQRYRTLTPLSGRDRAVIGFAAGGAETELVVDADGLVVEHPGRATRL
jgi:hypothetical protein